MSVYNIEKSVGYADEVTRDPLESPVVENKNLAFYPDRMALRYFNDSILTGLTALKSFGEFRTFGPSDAIARFLLVLDGTTIARYDYSGGYSAAGSHTSGDVGAYSSGDIAYFTFVKNAIRIGFWSGWKDTWARSLWYGYLNGKKFFNDNETFTGWYLEKSYLIGPPSTKFTLADTGGGNMTGKYQVFWTYEYDGYQESGIQSRENTGTSPTITITGAQGWATKTLAASGPLNINIELDYSEINKRVTAVNLYCRFDPNSGNDYGAIYHLGRVDINDGSWASTTGDAYDIDISLTSSDSSSFPAAYSVSGHSGALGLAEIVEEYFVKNNIVLGSEESKATISGGRVVSNYMKSMYINERLFVTRPQVVYKDDGNYTRTPWDERQVVLFSQLKKPDIFHWDIDYIDFTTVDGDSITDIQELYGALIVFKEYSMFVVQFNNSGNSLDWRIREHKTDIGAVAMNSVAKGNGALFFASSDNIYKFDGNEAIPITKYKNRVDYVENYYGAVSDVNDDIWGVYNPLTNQYILNFDDIDKALCYDIDTDSWWDWEWGTDVPLYLRKGVGNVVLGATATKVLEVANSRSATSGEANQDIYWETGWLAIDGDKYKEKRTKYIRFIYQSSDSFTFKVYKDFSASAAQTETIAASATLSEAYFECSHLNKLFRLEITGSSLEYFSLNDLQVVTEDEIKKR